MIRVIIHRLWILFLPMAACQPTYPPLEPRSTHVLEIMSDSTRSMALLSLPANYSPDRPWPLLIVLHGHGDRAEAFLELWKPVTDSLGFVLLAPQGEKPVHGAGWSWGRHSERLIRQWIGEVRTKIPVDQNKIFIGGFSAGGSLAYYMGLKYSHIFSGIVALGATLDPGSLSLVREPQRLKIYIGHGELENNFESSAKTAETEFNKLGATVSMNAYKNIGHSLPEPKWKEIEKILLFLNGTAVR